MCDIIEAPQRREDAQCSFEKTGNGVRRLRLPLSELLLQA